MILVKTYFNTEADGSPIHDSVPLKDLPVTYHGPFDTIPDAEMFMNNVWPDDDTEVYEQIADEFKRIPMSWVNDPSVLRHPDSRGESNDCNEKKSAA